MPVLFGRWAYLKFHDHFGWITVIIFSLCVTFEQIRVNVILLVQWLHITSCASGQRNKHIVFLTIAVLSRRIITLLWLWSYKMIVIDWWHGTSILFVWYIQPFQLAGFRVNFNIFQLARSLILCCNSSDIWFDFQQFAYYIVCSICVSVHFYFKFARFDRVHGKKLSVVSCTLFLI